MASPMAAKNSKRKFHYFIAFVGFLLVALELMLACNVVALYQSLVLSAYLLFNIYYDVGAWIDRHFVSKYGRRISYVEGKLIGGMILIPFWTLFSLLLGLIAPRVPQETIYLCSVAIVIVLTILSLVPHYIIKERSFSEKKRSAVRRAIGVSLAIPIPYIAVVIFLSASNILSSHSQSLAVLAFLPIMFFAMALSSMIASRSPLRDSLAAGLFFAGVTAIPFAVAVFIALPVFYQIPYICGLTVAYVTFIYWLRLVRAENRQKRERRTSHSINQ